MNHYYENMWDIALTLMINIILIIWDINYKISLIYFYNDIINVINITTLTLTIIIVVMVFTLTLIPLTLTVITIDITLTSTTILTIAPF